MQSLQLWFGGFYIMIVVQWELLVLRWWNFNKEEISAQSVVKTLIDKMEEYANFGFDFIQDKLEQDPSYFFKESAFLNVFTSFLVDNNSDDNNDEPYDLDWIFYLQ